MIPHRAECKVALEAGLVATTCRCCHLLLHKVVCLSGQRSRTSCGTGVATGRARGTSCRNRVSCERDKASAILLSVPGMCDSLIAKLPFAAIRNDHCKRPMMAGERELLFCHE